MDTNAADLYCSGLMTQTGPFCCSSWASYFLGDASNLAPSFRFKFCKSVHHRTIQINHQPDATIFQFIILTFIYSSTSFRCSPAHHQELNDCSGSLWFYLRIMVIAMLCSWSAPPRTQHGYHHDTKVKPEAATAVIGLLTMGGRTPKTSWAVNKCQDNKLENCCILLVIYLNCTVMMHGLTNLKL